MKRANESGASLVIALTVLVALMGIVLAFDMNVRRNIISVKSLENRTKLRESSRESPRRSQQPAHGFDPTRRRFLSR